MRTSWISLAAAGAVFLLPSFALATENHVAEAITHTRAAVGEGLDGKSAALVEQATQALEHANAAKAEKSNRFVRGGIVHLKQAIAHGKKGHPTIATRHAKAALSDLEHAPH